MAVYKPRRLRNETEPDQVREPSLYRSLCTSLLSTLLSLVMLVGTTFAWFTESITTGVYTITAGNLSTVTWYCKTWGESPTWELLKNGNKDLFGGMTFNASNATQEAYLKLENNSPNSVKYLISFLCVEETPDTLKNSNGTNTSDQELSKRMSFAYYTVASDTNPGGTIPSFNPSPDHSIKLDKSEGEPFSIPVPGGSTVFVKLELKLDNYDGTWTDEQTIKLQLKLVITQPGGNGELEENNTASQALQAEPPVTVGEAKTSEGANLTVGVTIENTLEPPSPAGEPADKPIVEPAVEPVVGPAAEPSNETATAPAAEDTSSAETAQELSSAPETTE